MARQFVSDEQLAEMCRKAFEVTQQPADRKLVLEVLKRHPSEETFKLVVQAMTVAELTDDANAAALTIIKKLGDNGVDVKEPVVEGRLRRHANRDRQRGVRERANDEGRDGIAAEASGTLARDWFAGRLSDQLWWRSCPLATKATENPLHDERQAWRGIVRSGRGHLSPHAKIVTLEQRDRACHRGFLVDCPSFDRASRNDVLDTLTKPSKGWSRSTIRKTRPPPMRHR